MSEAVKVWRTSHVHDDCDPAEGECYATYEEYADGDCEPGIWLSTSEAAVAEMRERIAAALDECRDFAAVESVCAVMQAIGLENRGV